MGFGDPKSTGHGFLVDSFLQVHTQVSGGPLDGIQLFYWPQFSEGAIARAYSQRHFRAP